MTDTAYTHTTPTAWPATIPTSLRPYPYPDLAPRLSPLPPHRVAIIVVNYNMPEATDAIASHIATHVSHPHDLIVVDNGSDICAPSGFTNVLLPDNVQTTGGWLAGLAHADHLAASTPYFAYWFIITSMRFLPDASALPIDPLSPLVNYLASDPNAVAIHPSLTSSSTTAWAHLKNRGTSHPRRTWTIDNIASLYRADWFDAIGRFDPSFIYAWGIDLEACYLARLHGRGIYVHDGVTIHKTTDVAYSMERMNMTADNRRHLASSNMAYVMERKYGANWNRMMREDYVEEEWR